MRRAVGARARRAVGALLTLAGLPVATLSSQTAAGLPSAVVTSSTIVDPSAVRVREVMTSQVGPRVAAPWRAAASTDTARRANGSTTSGRPMPDGEWTTRPATVTGGLRGEDRPFGLSPWFAPVLSAIAPGAGQGLLRQQRGVVYAAAEVYFVVRAIEASRDARREREAYRDIARRVARAPFPGERPDGAWAYYERLQYFLESGAYDRDPAGRFAPETDETTFNGSIWRLARETFWRDPDEAPDETSDAYRRAIAFYQARAVDEAFRWSWRDAQLEQDVYRQTIDRSNDAARRARQMVGLVLANHALSLVDAYVGVRLRVFADGAGAAQRLGVAGALPIGRDAGRR